MIIHRFLGVIALIVLLAGPAVADDAIQQEMNPPTNPSTNNEQIVTEFINAWSRLDPDELVTYFTEDGTYHNMSISVTVY